MNMSRLLLFGAGGHAKVVAELAELNHYRDIVFVEDDPKKTTFLGYEVVEEPIEGRPCIVAIGDNLVRQRFAYSIGNDFITLSHPSANISIRSTFGIGTVVMAGVTINSQVSIGMHCIINTNASVDHDCSIDDFVHLSPNVALAGNVAIGEGTHIGIGACVVQGIKVGKWCTVGAGAVVIRDIPDGATVVGNPARIIKQKEL